VVAVARGSFERFLALADQSPCRPQSLMSHILHSWNKLEKAVITQDRGQSAGIGDRISKTPSSRHLGLVRYLNFEDLKNSEFPLPLGKGC
jgi:hypothetical protein